MRERVLVILPKLSSVKRTILVFRLVCCLSMVNAVFRSIWLTNEAAIPLGVEILRASILAPIVATIMCEQIICTLGDELVLSLRGVDEEAAHPIMCIQKSIVLNWRIEESTAVEVRSTIR